MEKVKIKDLIFGIESISFKKTLEYLLDRVKNKDQKTFVVTVNPEILMLAIKNPNYLKVLKSANLALPDGVGIILAGKIFGKLLKERVPGVDLMDKLCEVASKQPITVGFLGGRENVAEKTAECLTQKYPGLKVTFALSEWPEDKSKIKNQISKMPLDSPRRSEIINHKSSIINHNMSADILFVAFGPPKQEIWIYDNLDRLPVHVAIGVGGSFDFISGRVARAPKLVRDLGFEWLFRLLIQPWRIRRQVSLVKFTFLVFKEKLS